MDEIPMLTLLPSRLPGRVRSSCRSDLGPKTDLGGFVEEGRNVKGSAGKNHEILVDSKKIGRGLGEKRPRNSPVSGRSQETGPGSKEPRLISVDASEQKMLQLIRFVPLKQRRRRRVLAAARPGGGGGEGEREALGKGSGDFLGATSVSGGLWERRFFLRGPAETGGVTASLKTSSRARRVDIESSSDSGQPPVESAVAACSRPRQRAQMRWRSPLLSGARYEPQERRGIFIKTPQALLEREKVCVKAANTQSRKVYVAGWRSRHGWLKAAGFLRRFLGLLVAEFNGGGSQEPAI
ncbi:hypothetical protein PO909_004159 [Leuciscus waleckii]